MTHIKFKDALGKALTNSLGKASTYSSDKVSECKELADKNGALFEQVMTYIARLREQMADLHRFLSDVTNRAHAQSDQRKGR